MVILLSSSSLFKMCEKQNTIVKHATFSLAIVAILGAQGSQ